MTALPEIGTSKSLRERVASIIEERILDGVWADGQRLPTESELGDQLGVSRSVVRDALRTLATRGLVEIRQGVGTSVARATDEAQRDAIFLTLRRAGTTVGEVAQVRAIIERMVAGVAATRRTQADLEAMRGHLYALARSVEWREWATALEAHLRWHLSILEATHLPVLTILLEPMQRIILGSSVPPVVDDPNYYDVPAEEAILDAIVARDEQAVDHAMREHFSFLEDDRYASMFRHPFRDVLVVDEVLGRSSEAGESTKR